VSNLATYLSLLASIAAAAAALHGSAPAASALMAVAVVADTFDGRFARLFERDESRQAFGAHLDSLSDVAAFGVAPPLCLAAIAAPTGGMEVTWWLAACVYALCAITRLGFYNLTATASADFIGLPVPVAALICSTALAFSPPPAVGIGLLLASAGAMIAPIPIRRPRGTGLALFVLWPVALIVMSVGRR
jgi:CDP-diacylglycerol--serine O-phosphatidyltransferase